MNPVLPSSSPLSLNEPALGVFTAPFSDPASLRTLAITFCIGQVAFLLREGF